LDINYLAQLIGIFIASVIGGFCVGYFLRISLKVIAFMLGFYIVLTAVFYYLGIIQFTIDAERFKEIIMNLISKIELPEIDWNKYGSAIAGGILGIYLGLIKH